ncbi:MAG TPA: hypothetical protein VF753_18700 [Terriglobales bacterium]
MELLLNLVWVLVAATVLYAWGRRRNHPQARPRLVVLLCLLALIFPVISATDDLHAMNSEMEDSISVRRSAKQTIAGKPVGQPFVYHAPAMAAANFSGFSLVDVGAVTNLEESAGITTLPLTVHSSRAPPRWVLA